MPRTVIIQDFAMTKSYQKWLEELWPDPQDRPVVLSIPVSQAGSASHETWVRNYRAAHGSFLTPFLEEYAPGQSFDQIGLIGFSAGCWGIGEILKDDSDASRVSFVYACDGLHGGSIGPLPSYQDRAKLTVPPDQYVKVGQHWIKYGKRAAAGDATMIVTYSKIVPTYPSTRETALALSTALSADGIQAPLDTSVFEAFGRGGFAAIGAVPPNAAPDGPEAHIYQANAVQESVWRTLLKSWVDGSPPRFGGWQNSDFQKLLLILTVMGLVLYALHRTSA